MPLLTNQDKNTLIGMPAVRVDNNFYFGHGFRLNDANLAKEAGVNCIDGKYVVSDAGYFDVDGASLNLKGEPEFVVIDGDPSEARKISNTLLRERG